MSRRRRLSRRTRLQLVTIALLVVLMVVLSLLRTCGRETTSPDDTAAPTGTLGTTAVTTGGTAGSWGVEATLIEVVDGDTIWVRMSDGREEKVRYIGVNAPEIAHEDSPADYLGDEAAVHNAELLASGPLRLETDVEERDEYGRLLAYVWAGEIFVNERMVLDGYSWAHNYAPNLTRQDALWAANDEARAAGRGVWGEESR
jgi:endonuclease YncB( thermonuclease family)